MRDAEVRPLPLVSGIGHLVGAISIDDLVLVRAERSSRRRRSGRRRVPPCRWSRRTAGARCGQPVQVPRRGRSSVCGALVASGVRRAGINRWWSGKPMPVEGPPPARGHQTNVRYIVIRADGARAAELPRTSLRSATTNGTRGFATVAVGRHDRLPGALAGSNESPAAPSFDTAHACTHRRRHVSTPIWMRPGSQGAKDSPMLPQEVPSPIWTPSSSRKSCSQVWRRCRKRREWRLRLVGRPGRATAATQACDSARRCSMRRPGIRSPIFSATWLLWHFSGSLH